MTTLNQLYALTIPEIQEVFLSVMQNVVDRAMLDQMIIAIENNDVDALFSATGFTPAVLSPILDRIEQTFKEAADITVDGWPTRIRTPTGITLFTFNMRNQRVVEQLRETSSSFITSITEEARANVRTYLEEGFVKGNNPRKTALDIVGRINPRTRKREGGIIGLSKNQISWVNNAERYLRSLDKKYLNLTLRDKRFDKIVEKAINSREPLKEQDITRLISSYKNKALKYRADTIARTETIQTINKSEYMSFVQAIDEGVVRSEDIKKEWDDVPDNKERSTHRILGAKHGKGKGIDFNDAFISLSGARLLHPGDKSLGATADEIANCRCKIKYRVDWKAQ